MKTEETLNLDIELLAKTITDLTNDKPDPDFAGLLNYSFTRIIIGSINSRFGKIDPILMISIKDLIRNVLLRFYNDVAEPYEDKKIEENGDLKEFIDTNF